MILKWIKWTCLALFLVSAGVAFFTTYQNVQLSEERAEYIRLPMPDEIAASIWPGQERFSFYKSLYFYSSIVSLAALAAFLVLYFLKYPWWYQLYVPLFITTGVAGKFIVDYGFTYIIFILGPLGWPAASATGLNITFFIQTLVVTSFLTLSTRMEKPRYKKISMALFRLSWLFSGVLNFPAILREGIL